MRTGALLAIAVLWATAFDVVLGAVGGYPVRMEAARIVAVDAALLAVVVVPVMAAVLVVGRLLPVSALADRVPVGTALLVAWAVVVVLRGRKLLTDDGPSGLAAVMTVILVGGLAVQLRRRRSGGSGLGTFVVATGAAVTALVGAVHLPIRGSEHLAPVAAAASAPATPERPNLLLIVLDTVRADHLGAYGYARGTSPWLDRFAETATVFRNAVASSSWTLPSHASLFTGLYPHAHGADFVEGAAAGHGAALAQLGRLDDTAIVRPLSSEAVTLAELASAAGLETGAVCANTAYLYRYFGLDQGFASYVDTPGAQPRQRLAGLALGLRLGLDRYWPFRRLVEGNERYYLLAEEVNRLALHWLAPRRDRRFFLFLNYMDAHEPYIPVASYRFLYPAASAEPTIDVDAIRSRRRGILPEERAPMVDAYDASLRYLDDQLAALFARLESWGLLERTVVVVTSDHGESFGEHHDLGHSNGVYQTEVHVPLVLRLPGQRAGARVERPVHLVDVFPTALAALGLERPSAVHGVPLEVEGPERELPVVSFTGRQADLVRGWPRFYDRTHAAVYGDGWKLIRRSDGSAELYDLGRDPGERVDLMAAQPVVASRLARALDRFETLVTPAYRARTPAPPPGAAQDRLRALGYLE